FRLLSPTFDNLGCSRRHVKKRTAIYSQNSPFVLRGVIGVNSDGTVTAWEFHNYNSGASAIQVKYDFPNQNIQFHNTKSPLRQGSYRGLAATANHFAREVHMDELAQLVKMDSVAFRLKNIKDERLRAVLQSAANSFEWDKKKTDGRGRGIACGFE